MKRLLLLILVLGVLMLSATATATVDIDLSKLTTEEIVELVELVSVELASRGIEKTASLPEGRYTVGRDIPAGRYIFTHPAKEGWFAVLKVTAPGVEEPILSEHVSPSKTYYLVLEEGQIFECDEPFLLTMTVGALFK